MNSPVQSLLQQRLLLEIEYNAEKQAYQQMAESIGVERQLKRGDAWWPVTISRTFFNSLNQRCVEIIRSNTDDEDIEHNFEFGRPVTFFSLVRQQSPKPSYFSFNATVSFADQGRMVVAVPDNAPLADLQAAVGLGVQLSFDETSYRTMFEALDRVIRAKGNRLAYLRDLFYTPTMQPQRYHFSPLSFPYLNKTQEHAVNQVLCAKDVSVVHGPPGTGKTTTLVEAIYETLMRESQVLVCAQSNMAVDWISEKLVDRGIAVLRIGNPTRVNDKMLSFTYERRFEAHPDYPALWAIRKTIREIRAHRKRGDEKFHQKIDRLKSRATELEIRINSELFDEARVIACTLVGASNRLLQGMKFNTLFIDEAAQALEAACWIPLRRCSRVVLAGDHQQLPPTIKSLPAMKGGLDKTMMQRIVENQPSTVTLLKIQYRMNDQIMRFSSEAFYGGQVESAPSVKDRGILDYDTPILWIDNSILSSTPLNPPSTGSSVGAAALPQERVGGDTREEFVGATFGRINREEARLTLLTLQIYFEKIGRQRLLDEHIDVGVISPYRAQVQYLRQLFRKKEFFKPFRHLISVNTVDGFQGQERDIILISLVRDNDAGQIGFLRDLRRMNVAITRARMKLIILGSVATLTRHPFYKKLHDYVESL